MRTSVNERRVLRLVPRRSPHFRLSLFTLVPRDNSLSILYHAYTGVHCHSEVGSTSLETQRSAAKRSRSAGAQLRLALLQAPRLQEAKGLVLD
jgi:hypothetical protein